MSYKFQLGSARLSGSTTFEQPLVVEDSFSANSLSASGDVNAGGDLTAGTITMSGFAVDADGDTALKSLKVDDGSTIGSDSQVGMLTFAADGDLTFHDGAFDFDVASHDGFNGLKLGGTLVTSDAGELNKLDGASADVTAAKLSKLSTLLDAEVDFLDGATDSGVASKAVIFDSDKDINGVRKLEASSELEAPKVKASTRLQTVSGGSIKAFLSSSGEVSGSGDLKIGGSAQFGGQIQVGTLFKMPTNLAGNILVGDATSFKEVAMSGDVAIASNGATTIQSDAVEQSMIADDAVGADQLASNAVVNASIASNAAIDMDKLDGGSLAASLTDAAQTDLLYVGDDDGSGGFALKSITFSNFEDAIFGNVSGDATVAAGGALTIAADSVKGTMLSASVADGSTLELSSDSLSVLKVPNALSQGDGIAAFSYDGSGALTVALSASVAGSGLAYAAGVLKVDIDEFSPLGSAALHQTQDKFLFSDNGVEKTITFSNLQDAVFAGVGGDASIAAGGVLTLAANSVSQTQMDDDAIGPDELAANAVTNVAVLDGTVKADKLDLDGSTDIGADLADADLLIVDDGAGGTNRVAALSRMKKYVYSAISGDATVTDSGVLSIAANAVAPRADGESLTEGYNIFADLTSNATVTLPSSGGSNVGDVIIVKAKGLTSAKIIINSQASAQKIDGENSVEIESPFGAVSMVYVATDDWRIV
jgi:cytoskeletal protein CcmA (bactofilin family)